MVVRAPLGRVQEAPNGCVSLSWMSLRLSLSLTLPKTQWRISSGRSRSSKESGRGWSQLPVRVPSAVSPAPGGPWGCQEGGEPLISAHSQGLAGTDGAAWPARPHPPELSGWPCRSPLAGNGLAERCLGAGSGDACSRGTSVPAAMEGPACGGSSSNGCSARPGWAGGAVCPRSASRVRQMLLVGTHR